MSLDASGRRKGYVDSGLGTMMVPRKDDAYPPDIESAIPENRDDRRRRVCFADARNEAPVEMNIRFPQEKRSAWRKNCVGTLITS